MGRFPPNPQYQRCGRAPRAKTGAEKTPVVGKPHGELFQLDISGSTLIAARERAHRSRPREPPLPWRLGQKAFPSSPGRRARRVRVGKNFDLTGLYVKTDHSRSLPRAGLDPALRENPAYQRGRAQPSSKGFSVAEPLSPRKFREWKSHVARYDFWHEHCSHDVDDPSRTTEREIEPTLDGTAQPASGSVVDRIAGPPGHVLVHGRVVAASPQRDHPSPPSPRIIEEGRESS